MNKNEINVIEPGHGSWLSSGSGSLPPRIHPPEASGVPDTKKAVLQSPQSTEALDQKIARINKQLESSLKRVEYSFHERPDVCVVSVIDTRTEEVIQQIPCEKILDIASAIWDRFGFLMSEEG